jgi:hypothetical protein
MAGTYFESFGRPLAAPELDRLRQLVSLHLAGADQVAEQAGIWASLADHTLRTMSLLGVPLEAYLRDDPLPLTLAQAVATHGITAQHRREIEYARNNAVLQVQGWRQDLATDLVRTVNNGVRARLGGSELGGILRDRFADYNRDVDQIAVTEVAAAHNNGMIAGQKPGSYVLGQSFPNACAWCRKNIHGKVLLVVLPPGTGEDPITSRDWAKEIWVGKSNFGRYQSPHERGTGRIREDRELWKPCAVGHPSCRCFWIGYRPKLHVVDEKGHIQIRPDILAKYGSN